MKTAGQKAEQREREKPIPDFAPGSNMSEASSTTGLFSLM